MWTGKGGEPPCEKCYVELGKGNVKSWRLYTLCQNQLLRAGMDGTVVGLDCKAVIAILELYGESKDVFEDIMICHDIRQEIEA